MFTLEELETEVRRLAEENPEFAYERIASSCYYTKGGDQNSPGCIMGRALTKLDPDIVPFLRMIDASPINIDGVLDKLGLTVSSYWFSRVQYKQDSGTPWAECVAYADAKREEAA
jgi:hypothetical protein